MDSSGPMNTLEPSTGEAKVTPSSRILRMRSLEALENIGFDGLAIGGLSVGEPKHEMIKVLDYLPGQMPADKPRYLMGVANPRIL